MLVFAAIVPHTPLLIPQIGKDNTAKLNASVVSIKTLEGHCYAAQADVVIIITPNEDTEQSSFIINFSPRFSGSFAEFGHFNEKPIYYGDNSIAYRMKERLETSLPVKLTTIPQLDYNVLVPLHYLLAHQKNTKVIPVAAANRSPAEHIEFGRHIAEELTETSQRVAVIASAATAHTLSKLSPAGYQPGAQRLDQRVVALIAAKKTDELLKIKTEQWDKYGLDELKAVMILLGILSEQNCRGRILSYESPFGIGYLSMEFEM